MAADNVKRFEVRLGKWGLGIFISGMSLLIFFSFLFGVMIGKDIDANPEKYSWGIARHVLGPSIPAENPVAPEQQKTAAAVRDVGKEQPTNENSEYDISDYDTLSKKSSSLRNSNTGNAGADQLAGEPAAQVGEGMPLAKSSPPVVSATPAAPPIPAVPETGLYPVSKPGLEKKEEKKIAERKTASEAHPQRSALVSPKEIEKKPVVKPTREKEREIGFSIAERKNVRKEEKHITAEKKPDQRVEKGVIAAKKNSLKVEKTLAAEKKSDKAASPKEVKKEEKIQKPEAKKYIAQVASYQDRRKADQVAGKLKSMGYNTRVVPMDLPGKGRWYRLTIGGLSSHEKAKEAVANIEKKIGASKGFIRPEGE